MFGTTAKKEEIKKYIVMKRYTGNTSFYTERGFASVEDADEYAKLLRKQEPDYTWCLFEQSKEYGNGEDKK